MTPERILSNRVSLPSDPMVLKELIPWRDEINAVIEEEIGKTYVFLDGDRRSCRSKECNLGSMATDAIIHLVRTFNRVIHKSV